jgi:hypothetical protein
MRGKITIFIALLISCVFACSSDKKYTDAIETGLNFLTAYENCEYGKACEFATPAAKKNLVMEQLLHNEKIDELRKQNNLTIILKDESISTDSLMDTVWATFVINGHISKDFFSDREPSISETAIEKRIIITKIDNKWLADFAY